MTGNRIPRPSNDKKDNKFGNFPKKWARVLENLHDSDTFMQDVQQFTKEEMDKTIVQCNENMAEIKKDMDADPDLKNAKEHVKELAAEYKEGISINESKAMYCVYLKNSL